MHVFKLLFLKTIPISNFTNLLFQKENTKKNLEVKVNLANKDLSNNLLKKNTVILKTSC